jgi:hypothetical protein
MARRPEKRWVSFIGFQDGSPEDNPQSEFNLPLWVRSGNREWPMDLVLSSSQAEEIVDLLNAWRMAYNRW